MGIRDVGAREGLDPTYEFHRCQPSQCRPIATV
jgi:hypothetical protein